MGDGDKAQTALLVELRTAEARQRALLAVLPDLMFRLDRAGTYLEFAGDLTRLATPAEELCGSNIHEILPAEVAAALMDCAAKALDSGGLELVEYRLRTLGGELRDFEARVVPAGPDEVVTIVRDITDAKLSERELRESRARVVQAGDQERRRLERNLHDGAQQRLVSVSLRLHLLARQLEDDPAAARASLTVAQEELAAGLEEIRELVRGLHPRALATHGLGPALGALVERALVPVELLDLPERRLSEELEAAAYYVIAEALTNSSKHAHATRITVSARIDGPDLVVAVADDGLGGAELARGTGLQGLADRVAAIGGRLDVTSGAGGTTVRALIPVQ